jgi:hypothetical protein
LPRFKIWQNVRTGAFPAKERAYAMIEDEIEKLKALRRKTQSKKKK